MLDLKFMVSVFRSLTATREVGAELLGLSGIYEMEERYAAVAKRGGQANKEIRIK